MIGRTLAAAAVAALLVAPAAAAQITQQQPADTARANPPAQMPANEGQMQPQQGQMQPDRMNQAQPMAGADSMPLDTAFLAHAVSGNIKEVRLGELAQKQASSKAVKEFGQTMVKAHREAYKASRGIADSLSVGKLDSMMAEDRATVERFEAMEGAAFDSAYIRLMVQEHAREVAAYRNQVQFGNHGMIRRYALQTLPVLRDHFDLAQRTARDLGIRVETPLAGEMNAAPNDTTAYMAPARDTATPANPMPNDMRPMPGDTTMRPPADTSMVPGQNVPRQAGEPPAPPVRVQPDTTTRVDIDARRPIGQGTTDTLQARPATRDSTP